MTIEISKQKSSICVVTDKIADVTSKPVFIFSAGFVLGYFTKYKVWIREHAYFFGCSQRSI